MNPLGVMVLKFFGGFIAERHPGIQRECLASLLCSLRVQPCANNEMGGWLDLVGYGNSNPRIQRCRIFGRLDQCASGLRSYFPNSLFLDFSLSPLKMRVMVRAGLPSHMGKVYKPLQG